MEWTKDQLYLIKISKSKVDKVYYLYHPESDCLWIDSSLDSLDDGLVVELTKDQYIEKEKELNGNINT